MKKFCGFHGSTVTFQGHFWTKRKYQIKTFLAVQQAHTENEFSEPVTEEYFKRNMDIFWKTNSLKIPIKNV